MRVASQPHQKHRQGKMGEERERECRSRRRNSSGREEEPKEVMAKKNDPTPLEEGELKREQAPKGGGRELRLGNAGFCCSSKNTGPAPCSVVCCLFTAAASQTTFQERPLPFYHSILLFLCFPVPDGPQLIF